MSALISGTTPSVQFIFKNVDPADIAVAYLTVRVGDSVVIEKDITEASVQNNTLTWVLTQEETLRLNVGDTCRICCDWKTSSGVRGRSKMATMTVEESGKSCVI